MPDPSTLRAQANQLRTDATAMRTQAAALVQGVSDVQRHYPQGHQSVWGGPSADQFFGELGTGHTQLQNIVDEINAYAGACDRKATDLDNQAASTPVPSHVR